VPAFKTSFKLQLKPSKSINRMLLAVHLLVASIMLLTTPSILIFVLSLLAITVSYVYFYRWHVAQSLKKSIVEVSLNALNVWSVRTVSTKYNEVTLLSSRFISQYLIILNFRISPMRRYTVLIVKSEIGENKFRHLSVRLKIML
jgi:hypothetical protein